MKPSNLSQLKIDPEQKRRPRGTVLGIFVVIGLIAGAAVLFVTLRSGPERRVIGGSSKEFKPGTENAVASANVTAAETTRAKEVTGPVSKPKVDESKSLLTVSGYIITRERIELSPRFQGVVSWIGVRKGDQVKKDQVVVRLDDAEQRARVQEGEGRLASAKVALEKAELAYGRMKSLSANKAISQDFVDDARLAVEAAKAAIREVEGQLALARTYLEWTVIRSPIDGVVLEKLVEPGELVAPMSFGGPRGPSTALVAVADPKDLQVEIDLNEADLAKVGAGAHCRVTPEAYPEFSYEAVVAEIAPEANRQKGTLQIKVQILKPDRHLTPELTAKVEFPKP